MAAEVNVMDIVPQCKPSIQSRFSTLRYMKWLVGHTSHGEEKVFLHKEKNINFSKERNRNIVSIRENTMKYIGDGIPIGMSYDGSPVTNTAGTDAGMVNNDVIVMRGTISDQNSFEKRNRKKRAAKATTHERNMLEFVIDHFIEAFNNKHLKINRFNKPNQYDSGFVIQYMRCYYGVEVKQFSNAPHLLH
ncbi:uncharacterized protein LOC124684655 [Lolium rigidum]|uniref:uncharacterized protein LOC124684655 n=1 Tax=Lolium rigidum TaxID=89674 RepID=UPI001F5CDC90|nr:uncharacterized protein LOC124684655 [Lolium rigidum]